MKKFRYLKYTIKYLFDSQVPFIKKIWIYLILIYFISPLELFTDLFFGIGFLIDAVILFLALKKLAVVLEKYVTEKENCLDPKYGNTIDNIEYKVHDDE